MKDVLEIYQHLYDTFCPVVCIDETDKQLIKKTHIARRLGQPKKVDSVYVRNGVADVFIIFNPLTDRRETVVTQIRTASNFAKNFRHTSDILYQRTEKIVLDIVNLNTHFQASLYNAFSLEEACRLTERFEYTHRSMEASWTWLKLKLASCVPMLWEKRMQILKASNSRHIWIIKRNVECAKINWYFSTHDARIKRY